MPITYYPDPLPATYGTALGLVIEKTQVEPDGAVSPLLYFDHAAGKWVVEDSPACLKPYSRRDGADARAQFVAVPRGVVVEPGVVFKIYALGSDGSRGEVRQIMSRRDVEAILGAD